MSQSDKESNINNHDNNSDEDILDENNVNSNDDEGETKINNNKVLSTEKLERFQQDLNKRGMIYISRIPPGMTPSTVRRYMSQFGTVHRIFLTPEDSNSAKKRKKNGGNRGKRYTEGWVEFGRKKIAKAVAESLNNTQIGGRRRSNYHSDLWNIKYLKGYKWYHMTEQAAYARAVRDTKIREEISQSRKETTFYIEKVKQSRAITAMESKKRKKNSNAFEEEQKRRRSFKQRKTITKLESKPMADNILAKVIPQKK